MNQRNVKSGNSRGTTAVNHWLIHQAACRAPQSLSQRLEEEYPALARRMEEQGIVTVRVCVDVNGRLTSDPTTLQGTGSARLDEGALTLARAGSGHYRAMMEDGQPVNSCYPFRIRFQLKN
jgi:TonB family protein